MASLASNIIFEPDSTINGVGRYCNVARAKSAVAKGSAKPMLEVDIVSSGLSSCRLPSCLDGSGMVDGSDKL